MNKYYKKMNLVLITAVTNINNKLSIYSNEERFEQLVDKTIKSVNKKIPNCYMILLEGSQLCDRQKSILMEKGISYIHFHDIKEYHKSYGEIMLITSYLESDNFNNIKENIDNLIKISGRYELLEDFDFNCDKEINVIKKKENTTWSGFGLCETRYYKILKENIKRFTVALQIMRKKGFNIDIEHGFFKYNVVKIDKCIEKIHVGGNIAPTGEYVID